MATDFISITTTHVGVCGSDLQKLEVGTELEVLGHEIVGLAVIDGQSQRVAVNPLISCGQCEFCLSDRAMFCENLSVIGRDAPGALAGTIAVPLTNIVPLHDAIEDGTAVLADPYAVVVHGASLLPELSKAQRIVIIGDGIIGLLNLVYLYIYGSKKAHYVLVSPKEERLEHLQTWLGEWAPQSFVQRVRFTTSLEDEKLFDVAIEAVGRNQIKTFTQAVRSLVPRGKVLSYGVYPPQSIMNVDMRALMYKEVSVIGVNSYNPQDFKQAIEDLYTHHTIMTTLVGEIYQWSDRSEAIRAARDKIKGISKKIVIKVEQL
ncbi:MAG: alcohol dehydrogenase catalytic domain-containing protein [Candidatus Microsaccharimonas sp.]